MDSTNSNIGQLTLSYAGRWLIRFPDDREVELTSGSICEVRIGGAWIRTRVESADGIYYSVTPGIEFYVGMPARLP